MVSEEHGVQQQDIQTPTMHHDRLVCQSHHSMFTSLKLYAYHRCYHSSSCSSSRSQCFRSCLNGPSSHQNTMPDTRYIPKSRGKPNNAPHQKRTAGSLQACSVNKQLYVRPIRQLSSRKQRACHLRCRLASTHG